MNQKLSAILATLLLLSAGILIGRNLGDHAFPRHFAKPTDPAALHRTIFRESALAHKMLDGLRGLEIGGSAHNGFGLNTLNVDYTDDTTTIYKQEEMKLAGKYLKVDIVASGDDLPFKDNTMDFVVSSHVIEHFYDPVRAIQEWFRVVRPGGYIFIISPHRDRIGEAVTELTPASMIIERHKHPHPPKVETHEHHSCWRTSDFVEFCKYYKWKIVAVQDTDDKVGNGFTVVLQKTGHLQREKKPT